MLNVFFCKTCSSRSSLLDSFVSFVSEFVSFVVHSEGPFPAHFLTPPFVSRCRTKMVVPQS